MASAEPELSRSAAGRLIREGAVLINGRPGRASDKVAAGDVVEFDLPAPIELKPSGEAIPLNVLYEDQDLVVVDKAAGMVVHPAAGHSTGTLVHALLGRGGSWSSTGGDLRPGIVHRLDRGTSGLILVARNDPAHRSLQDQLAGRSLARTYLALARGALAGEGGVLEGPIGRDPSHRRRMAVVEGGRFARTRFKVLERLPGYTLVECELDTGRTHQIRVHLTALGHPIAGDAEYGGRRPGEPDRPMLHATRLRLRHPRTGEPLVFESPPPADFAAFLASLR